MTGTGRAHGAPSSVLASRIAVESEEPLPTIRELGLEDAKRQAFEWQQRRGHARLNDMHGYLSGRPGGRWVLETHGILGVVAEQILVAIEAEVEKEVTRRALKGLGDPADAQEFSFVAHYSRSLRFFADGQANALVVGLHGLANLTVRSLEFERPLDAAELKKLGIKSGDFHPGSRGKSAWISLNQPTVTALADHAATRSSASISLANALSAVADEAAVADLLEFRNTQYHRWRGESAGVTGIPHGVTTAAEVLAAGQSVGFGPDLLPPYVEGADTLTELTRASRSALDALVAHMEPIHTAWYSAFLDAFAGK